MEGCDRGPTFVKYSKVSKRKIFVGNINFQVRRKELKDFFLQFGPVENCVFNSKSKNSKGKRCRIAFVTWKNEADALAVLNLGGECLKLRGRRLRVHAVKDADRTQRTELEDEKGDCAGDMDRDRNKNANMELVFEEMSAVDQSGVQLNNLDDDTLMIILSLLPLRERIRCERVCTRWRCLLLKMWLSTRSLQFYGVFGGFKYSVSGLPGLTDASLQSMLSKTQGNLTSLDVSASAWYLSSAALEAIATLCPMLEELCLDSTKGIKKRHMEILARECSRLKRFSAQHCALSEKAIWWILHMCKDLEMLNLKENRMTGKCFYVSGSKLQTVVLSECRKVTDDAVRMLTARSPNIQAIDCSSTNISNESLNFLTQNVVNLRELNVSSVPSLTNAGLLKIGDFSKLVILKMSSIHCLSDELFNVITRNCPHLETLEISLSADFLGGGDLTVVGLRKLGRLAKLHTLDVSSRDKFTDEVLNDIVRNKALISLKARKCHALTDESLVQLAINCPELEYLDIAGNPNITQLTVYALIANKPENQIKPFNLSIDGNNIREMQDPLPPWLSIQRQMDRYSDDDEEIDEFDSDNDAFPSDISDYDLDPQYQHMLEGQIFDDIF